MLDFETQYFVIQTMWWRSRSRVWLRIPYTDLLKTTDFWECFKLTDSNACNAIWCCESQEWFKFEINPIFVSFGANQWLFPEFSARDFLVPFFTHESTRWINQTPEAVYWREFCTMKLYLSISQHIKRLCFIVNPSLPRNLQRKFIAQFDALPIDCNPIAMWICNQIYYFESYWCLLKSLWHLLWIRMWHYWQELI